MQAYLWKSKNIEDFTSMNQMEVAFLNQIL